MLAEGGLGIGLVCFLGLLVSSCQPATATPTRQHAITEIATTKRPTATKPFSDTPESATLENNTTPSLVSEDPTPESTPVVETIAATETTLPPAATATSVFPKYSGPPLDRDDTGIQIHLHREDLDQIFNYLRTLGLGWVKTQVSWKLYQPEPDRYDDFRWGELDRLVEAAEEEGIKVMISVAKAPEWSRPTTELDGPPMDFAAFQNFMVYLATRYQGRVHAYELWNEPNLQREWNGMPLNAVSLVELVSAGASGVRQIDSQAILISAAPATTGINDGITAIDDRLFLQQMVSAGITDIVDAVGAHPYGWANPPDSSVNKPDPSIPSHNNHPSFFFADTLQDYRAILDSAGKVDTPIWVTEFGWGSYDGLEIAAPQEVAYMTSVDEQQQASYTLRAYELAHEQDWLGPMILWNLNFGPTLGADFPVSAYSALRPDGTPRALYHSLASIAWSEE